MTQESTNHSEARLMGYKSLALVRADHCRTFIQLVKSICNSPLSRYNHFLPYTAAFFGSQSKNMSDLKELWEALKKADSKSLLKKHLTPARYEKLKNKKTKFGGTLADCIRSGKLRKCLINRCYFIFFFFFTHI